MRENLHIIIHGESGTGKSWLYKQYFNANSIDFTVANLANASRLGSISAELSNIVFREGRSEKVAYEEEKSTEGGIGISGTGLKAAVAHTGQFKIGQTEPFEKCLALLRETSGKKPCVLVFDNLEAAFTEPLLKELVSRGN